MDRMDSALQAAWAAGDILAERFVQPKQLSVKGYRDVVTDADFAAQAAILNVLHGAHPEDDFLAEEGVGEADALANGGRPLWVIDPLDGTTNFSRQFPSFSVSIGLVESGLPVLGVVHDPLRRVTFLAERGRGAEMLSDDADPVPLRISTTESLDQALVGLDWSHADDLRAKTLDALRPMAMACRSVRAVGSAALGLAYCAAGWLDGYFHFSLLPWDAAAGVAIAIEAGAALTAPDGSEWRFGMPRLAMSNGHIHTAMIEAIRGGTTHQQP